MPDKKQGNWFIRATIIDKANGPTHKMVTTHGSYSHASMHLVNRIGAERSPGPNPRFTKGKMSFDILPLKKNKEMKNAKVRAESLNEYIELPRIRTRQQIIEEAEKRAFDKKKDENNDGKKGKSPKDTPENPKGNKDKTNVADTGTKNKTLTGEKPNKIDMKPNLDPQKIGTDLHPTVQPSPSNSGSS